MFLQSLLVTLLTIKKTRSLALNPADTLETKTFAPRSLWSALRSRFDTMDPRIPVAAILFTYLLLGMTVLGFNRNPTQAFITTVSCVVLEMSLTRLLYKKWIFPLSALITSFSLSFLLNYSHDYFLLAVPVFFAIGSKYIFTFNGKHALNPAMMGVSLSLLFSQELITAAPAYQWNGIALMSLFIVALGMLFVIPKVPRVVLVVAFLTTFTIQTALRAWIMKYHLPFETLFLGTLSSPSFFIFTFFMITDPATSPGDKRQQIIVGISLALVDLVLHLYQSYYTFFYAALIVGGFRLIMRHLDQAKVVGFFNYFKTRFIESRYYLKLGAFVLIAIIGHTVYAGYIRPSVTNLKLDFKLTQVAAMDSGLTSQEKGDLLEIVDPRVAHISKWILSNGESASTADFDNDGHLDIFLTNLLKKTSERSTLYRNVGTDVDGHRKFEPFVVPVLDQIRNNPKTEGIITNAIFVDFDNDGDQDLFLIMAFGHSRLLKNMLIESGKVSFVDVSKEIGLVDYTNAIGATFADFNKDGLLDLFVLNVWPEHLPNYHEPNVLNIFNLPRQESDDDNRPFDFMHDSWHMSNNGGINYIYYQTPDHKFERLDSAQMGFPETRWSLAVGVADFNKDGWPDIYIANDFGPDDLYFSHRGQRFENIKGTIFGSIGKDTYKGMNVSIADFDHSGWLDVYVSNVHHALQAEGSLYWKFSDGDTAWRPKIEEQATAKSILNENRFGWGASAFDINNDGWVDLAQANGMVDDTYDKKSETCPDYWYVNEKIARSPPSIHRYATKWGDIRGFCIYGKERNRVYLNRGFQAQPQFIDVAEQVGLSHLASSRGVISADFANHGRRDVLFSLPFEAPQFYKNEFVSTGKEAPGWIGFDFVSLNSTCNREGIGSRVDLIVDYNDGRQMKISQEKQMVSGFSSQSDKRLHFGLGNNVKSVTAQVDWCYGKSRKVLTQLEINRYHTLELGRQ